MQADSRTRPTAVAGLFYPSDPDLLRTQVLDLLVDVAVSQSMPKALIAPHAGYAYSGRVAAAAFATLRDSAQTITRVVLIGPAHYLQVRGIAGPTVDAFETPLGRVPIDVEALRQIADLPFVIRADAPHAPEHALEVELPFLQTLTGIIPIGATCCRRCRSTGRRQCPATVVGRVGDADRRQLRFIPLS